MLYPESDDFESNGLDVSLPFLYGKEATPLLEDGVILGVTDKLKEEIDDVRKGKTNGGESVDNGVSTRFSLNQADRTREYLSRQVRRPFFPVNQIKEALFRLEVQDYDVRVFAMRLEKEGEKVLPAELWAENEDGERCIDLSLLDEINPAFYKLKEVPGALKCLRIFSKDLLLSGGDAGERLRFVRSRRKKEAEYADEMRERLVDSVDFEYRLSGDRTRMEFQSPVERESYRHLEEYVQGVANKLFRAGSFSQFKPKVYLTRSNEFNAFVFSIGNQAAAREYILSGLRSGKPVELPVFVHKGLLDKLESEDELAGILGHELSHILQPDYLGETDNSKRRRLEYDADFSGITLADAAGYNPRAVIDMQKRFDSSNDHLLKNLGWGTHPPSSRRVIEMEKFLSEPQRVFPNASKPFEKLPETVRQALQFIDSSEKQGVSPLSFVSDDMDENVARVKGWRESSDFLSEVVIRRLDVSCRSMLKDRLVEQELLYDTLGYRKFLFQEIENFILAYKRAKASLGENEVLECDRPTENGGVNRTGLLLANPPGQTDEYLPKNLDLLERVRVPKRAYVDQVRKRAEFESDLHLEKFEDLLDTENEAIQQFWDFMNKDSTNVLSNDDKLNTLMNWLRCFMFSNSPHMFALSKTSSVVVEKKEYKGSGGREGVKKLRLLAGRLRTSQKHEAKKEKPAVVTSRKTTETRREYLYGGVERSFVDGNWFDKIGVWETRFEELPEFVKPIAMAARERGCDGVREFFHLESEVSDELVWYIAHQVCGSYCYNNMGYEYFNIQTVFRGLKSPTISRLAKAIEVLESKTLQHYLSVYGGNRVQEKLFTQMLKAIAFALKPRNDEEREIQKGVMRRLATDLSITDIGDIYFPDRLSPESVALINSDHVKKIGDQWSMDSKCCKEYGLVASNGLIFAEYGGVAEDLMHMGGFTALTNLPEGLRRLDLESVDEDVVGRRVMDLLKLNDYSRIYELRKRPALRKLNEKVRKMVACMKGYLDMTYSDGLMSSSAVGYQWNEEKSFWSINGINPKVSIASLKPLVRQFAGELYVDLRKHFPRKVKNPEEVEDFLFRTFSYCTGDADKISRARLMHEMKPSMSDERVLKESGIDLCWYSSREQARHLPEKLNRVSVDHESAVHYLREVKSDDPNAQDLLEFIEMCPGGKMNVAMFYIAAGFLVSFKSLFEQSSGGVNSAPPSYLIKFVRKAARVYHNEWKDLEQYKVLDQQLSHWEWRYANPLGVNMDVDAKVMDDYLGVDGKWLRFRDDGRTDFGRLVSCIEGLCSDFRFYAKYKCDSKNLHDVEFSWPLLMEDLWNDVDVWEGVLSIRDKKLPSNIEKNLMKEFVSAMHKIVDDPENLDVVLKMQSGFFKEFILEKKMEKMGVKSLDEIERYLGYFTSFTHEASTRNQISARVENGRRGYVEELKRRLMKESFMEVLGVSEVPEFIKIVSGVNKLDGLEERDCRIIVDEHRFDNLGDRIYLIKSRSPMRADEDLEEMEERFAKWNDVRNRFEESKILAVYNEKILKERKDAASVVLGTEEDVRVFSDHVIEDNESRLEIGPVYRLRLVSQPLMDWHASELRKSGSYEGSSALKARVVRDLPEAHPLRDIFIINQLFVDIWQRLGELEGPTLGELFKLREKRIDLNQGLALMPEYVDVSFLKNYSLFEIEGLYEKFDHLGFESRFEVLSMIRVVLDEVSSDQHPMLRRLMFRLEKKGYWEVLRERAKYDPRVFDKYLDEVIRFYPEPTMERDDLIMDIGMDLAKTPEQIRRVERLMFAEQVRWPDAKDDGLVKKQFDSLEKMKGMIGLMSAQQRASYFLWMMGGEMPLFEATTCKQTGISLEARGKSLWQMSSSERRTVLYDLFLGKEGIYERINRPSSQGGSRGRGGPICPWKTWIMDEDLMDFVSDGIFDLMLRDSRLDESLPEDHSTNVEGRRMMKIIFRSLFSKEKNSARRADMMVNIVEGLLVVKEGGKALGMGEMMRIVLEQLGVVGIKAAQVLSEQPDLLPGSIRAELEHLKDSSTPFAKSGILSYLEGEGWIHGERGNKVVEVGDLLGSASIKQVHVGVMDDGKRVAIKAKRPRIDKSFEQDIELFRVILKELRKEGFRVPEFLLGEIERGVREELDFGREVDNQNALRETLRQRDAKIGLTFAGSRVEVPVEVAAPLTVPGVLYPDERGDADYGLILEDFVVGFSLKEIVGYKAALAGGHAKNIKKYREKAKFMYGEVDFSKFESYVVDFNTARFQAEFGMELLRQINSDGAFHADPHAGNIYFDFLSEGGMKVVLIDLGSAGFSCSSVEPKVGEDIGSEEKEIGDEIVDTVREAVGSAEFDYRDDFRDFLTAFFAPEDKLSVVRKNEIIAGVISKYSGLDYTSERVEGVIGSEPGSSEKIKKILYDILENLGENGVLNKSFRLFLKTIATGADHFDRLREIVGPEMEEIRRGAFRPDMLLPRLIQFRLLNGALLT